MKTSLLPTAIANNGQSIGGSTYQLLPYTVYVGGHYVVKHHNMEAEYSKHYYMGTQRIASKLNRRVLGDALPSVPEPEPTPENFKTNSNSGPHVNNVVLTDLSENLTRFNMPGVPTFTPAQLAAPGLPQAAPYEWFPCDDFTLEIDPESLLPADDAASPVVYDYNTLAQLQCLCRNEETRAQMHQWGYLCIHFDELYFYHSDYLGHTEYITDAGGYPYQFFYYSPFGESLVTQKAEDQGAYNSPYRFNAKELDEETGNYYYGARYYNPKWSLWLSVDPMASERSWLTPYNFVSNNPITRIDPDGMLDDWVERDGQIVWDENVTSSSDPDLKLGDKYLGKTGSELNEQTGDAVYYHANGTKTTKKNTLPEVTVTPNGGYQTSNPSIGSNNKTDYVYNYRDLTIRSSIFSTDNPIATYILSQESKGNFGILNGHDYWMTYGHTLGNLILADQYLRMADMVSGGSPGRTTVSKGYSLKPTPSLRPSIPNTFSDYLKTQKGVDIGKYPGRGNWMKQKALEYNQMRRG